MKLFKTCLKDNIKKNYKDFVNKLLEKLNAV